MSYVFVSPNWFFIYSILLEMFFFVITLVLAFFAYKIYKLSEDNHAQLFSFAFLSISISYLAQAFLNFLIINKLDDDVSYLINMRDVALLNLFGLYAHALFFIIGLLLLTYVTLKIENFRAFSLLLSIIVAAIFFSPNKLFLFYVLLVILLVHAVIYYASNYLNNKKINTLVVLMAFVFLLLSTFLFLFALQEELYYVIGHILEFVAYLLILFNLILIFQHGKKTR